MRILSYFGSQFGTWHVEFLERFSILKRMF